MTSAPGARGGGAASLARPRPPPRPVPGRDPLSGTGGPARPRGLRVAPAQGPALSFKKWPAAEGRGLRAEGAARCGGRRGAECSPGRVGGSGKRARPPRLQSGPADPRGSLSRPGPAGMREKGAHQVAGLRLAPGTRARQEAPRASRRPRPELPATPGPARVPPAAARRPGGQGRARTRACGDSLSGGRPPPGCTRGGCPLAFPAGPGTDSVSPRVGAGRTGSTRRSRGASVLVCGLPPPPHALGRQMAEVSGSPPGSPGASELRLDGTCPCPSTDGGLRGAGVLPAPPPPGGPVGRAHSSPVLLSAKTAKNTPGWGRAAVSQGFLQIKTACSRNPEPAVPGGAAR